MLDIKNSVVIDSFATTLNFPQIYSVENITCSDCKNLIVFNNPSHTSSNSELIFIDFENDTEFLLGNESELVGINDFDNDGLKEIMMYWNSIKIYGNGTTTASTKASINPSSFKLNQNYPNPFNPITSISYQVQLSGDVTLNIYDVLGNRIKT